MLSSDVAATGEACGLPVAGFCLQPTCIPSADKAWKNLVSISETNLSPIDFTSHETLGVLKKAMEEMPFANLSLPNLRSMYGLAPTDTWPTVSSLPTLHHTGQPRFCIDHLPPHGRCLLSSYPS